MATPSAKAPATRPSATLASARLGLAPISSYPLVDIAVDGTPATFLLDTGCGSGIVVASDWLQSVGIPEEQRFLSTPSIPAAVLPELSLADGSAHARSRRATLHPFHSMRLMCGQQVEGMLGWDALGARAAEIDMPGRTFTLWRDFSPGRFDGFVAMPLVTCRDMRQRPYTILRLGGRAIPALLDTCELEAIKVPRHLLHVEDVELGEPRRAGGTFDLMDDSPAFGVRGTLADAMLGQISLRQPRVAILNDPDARQRFAVVGAPVLKNYRLGFDFWTGQVYLAGPQTLAAAAPTDEAIRVAEAVTGLRDADLADAD